MCHFQTCVCVCVCSTRTSNLTEELVSFFFIPTFVVVVVDVGHGYSLLLYTHKKEQLCTSKLFSCPNTIFNFFPCCFYWKRRVKKKGSAANVLKQGGSNILLHQMNRDWTAALNLLSQLFVEYHWHWGCLQIVTSVGRNALFKQRKREFI